MAALNSPLPEEGMGREAVLGELAELIVGNGLRTNVLARNGNKIMAVAEDLTINDGNATLALRYLSATQGWRLM